MTYPFIEISSARQDTFSYATHPIIEMSPVIKQVTLSYATLHTVANPFIISRIQLEKIGTNENSKILVLKKKIYSKLKFVIYVLKNKKECTDKTIFPIGICIY